MLEFDQTNYYSIGL